MRNQLIDLTASNSYIPEEVLKKISFEDLHNIYIEGYLGKRYYAGMNHVNSLEKLYIHNLKQATGYKYANVHPLSGSIANTAIYSALLSDGDVILSLSLKDGGHLTHTSIININKKYNIVHYCLDEDGIINYESIEKLAEAHKPKLIIAGYSCYMFDIDHAKIREIANKSSAYYMFDASHVIGFVITNIFKSPTKFAHILMSTTHKTFRGAKGAFILCNDEQIHNSISISLFPGTQAGLNSLSLIINAHTSSYILTDKYKKIMKQIVANAIFMIGELKRKKVSLLHYETENHILVIECENNNEAKRVVNTLEEFNIITTLNATHKNASFMSATGIRIGLACVTQRNITIENISLLCSVIERIYFNRYNAEEIIKDVTNIVSSLCHINMTK